MSIRIFAYKLNTRRHIRPRYLLEPENGILLDLEGFKVFEVYLFAVFSSYLTKICLGFVVWVDGQPFPTVADTFGFRVHVLLKVAILLAH